MGEKNGAAGLKRLVAALAFFMSLYGAYSLDIERSFIFGEVAPGVETDFSSVDFINTITVLPVTFQDASGFGLAFSPFSFATKNKSASSMTFVNPVLFYNFFRDSHVRLGHFVSANALDMYNIGFWRFSAGVSFSWQPEADIFGAFSAHVEVVHFQAGYTYYENKGAFYMRIGFDLFVLLIGTSRSEREKYEKDTFGLK
ncbi:MAG: hypothetical protein LBD58_10045 [Treponema sp.]|jgi:hypothetical protein|nr:hypothetical protein [Treponema sp.]